MHYRINNYFPHTITGEWTGSVSPCSYIRSDYIRVGISCLSVGACPARTSGTVDINVTKLGRTKKLAEENAVREYKEKYEAARKTLWDRIYSNKEECRKYYLDSQIKTPIENFKSGRKGWLITGKYNLALDTIQNYLLENNARLALPAYNEREDQFIEIKISWTQNDEILKKVREGELQGVIGKSTNNLDAYAYIVWD